uniref:Uncharacterized protein n=1 Tax=Oryza glumipatula TaxID=40148 RepID=A0A0D9Z4H2_9ORYZ
MAGWIRHDCRCSGDGRLRAGGVEAQRRQAGGEASADPAAAPHPTRMVLATAARLRAVRPWIRLRRRAPHMVHSLSS